MKLSLAAYLSLLSPNARVVGSEVDIFVSSIKDIKGSRSTDQNVNVLQTHELTGTGDGWDTYIEFTPNSQKYVGTMFLTPPSNVEASQVSAFKIEGNIKGPTYSWQNWKLHARNFNTKKWELLVTNQGKPEWTWNLWENSLPVQDFSQYLNGSGNMKIRLLSSNSKDALNVDFLKMTLTYSGAPPEPDPTFNPTSPPTSNPTDNPTASPTNPPTEPKPTSNPTISPTPNPTLNPIASPTNPPTAASPTGNTILNMGDTFTYDLPGMQSSYTTDVVIIDLFDTSQNDVTNIKSEGRVVICYFSGGSMEDWRSDKDEFPNEALGKDLGDWPGEVWLDTRNDIVHDIMRNRIRLAASKGCDGVEADNVDGYGNDTGFNISEMDSKDYLQNVLAAEAHIHNLLIGLKNSPDIVMEMEPYFDFSIEEECWEYNECCMYEPFVTNGKPVFAVEYPNNQQSLCSTFAGYGFTLIFGNYDLNRMWFCPSSQRLLLENYGEEHQRNLGWCSS